MAPDDAAQVAPSKTAFTQMKGWFPSARELHLPKAVMLFRPGDSADKIFIVQLGMVRISRIMENGNELTFALRGSGSMLGFAAVIAEIPHETAAVTLTATRVTVIAGHEFTSAVRNDVNLAWQIQQLQAWELIRQASEMSVRHFGKARNRILSVFRQIVSEQAGSGSVTHSRLPFTNRDLASIAGFSPEHLSRVLNDLERDRVVTRKGNKLIIESADSDVYERV